MEARVIEPLNALEASLNTLLSSLTKTNTFSGAPTAARDLLSADDALTSALVQLKQHQENYSRILRLRSEADRLQEQIKDIVRTCIDLRSEIGDIHPSLLEDTDEDDDDDDDDDDDEDEHEEGINHKKPARREVDYDTLLSFAARIGKHNAAAAQEAEQESTRLRLEASFKKQHQQQQQSQSQSQSTGSQTQTNGDTISYELHTQTQTGTQSTDPNSSNNNNNTTQESQAALTAINESLAFQRASAGMAFPAPDRLRMGILGQLQLLKEQAGEEAVEKEVERLVRASEQVAEMETDNNNNTTAAGTETGTVLTGVDVKSEREQQSSAAIPSSMRPGQSNSLGGGDDARQRLPPAVQPAKPKPVGFDIEDSDDDDD